MKVLTIAAVALKRFARDRANLFFVFILPIGIIILIGAQFGGGFTPVLGTFAPGGNNDRVSEALFSALEATGEVELRPYESEEALVGAVAKGVVEAGVRLPERLTVELETGGAVVVTLIGPEGVEIGAYEALVTEAVFTAARTEAAIRIVVGFGADRDEAAAAIDGLSGVVPEVTVATTEVGQSLFQGLTSGFQLGSTSQLILFMFLTGLTGSAALIQSKRYGVTRRMLSTPTSAGTVVGGEALGRFGVVLVQGLYIVIATTLMFQIDWGNLLAAVAILVAFGACGAGAAMLFGTLFRNDQQATGVGVIVGLTLAALGGCMVPIELFPPAMETVARFTPHAWALDAFSEIQRRGGGLGDILPQLAVIAGFAAVLLALATWRMRVTLGRTEATSN